MYFDIFHEQNWSVNILKLITVSDLLFFLVQLAFMEAVMQLASCRLEFSETFFHLGPSFFLMGWVISLLVVCRMTESLKLFCRTTAMLVGWSETLSSFHHTHTHTLTSIKFNSVSLLNYLLEMAGEGDIFKSSQLAIAKSSSIVLLVWKMVAQKMSFC